MGAGTAPQTASVSTSTREQPPPQPLHPALRRPADRRLGDRGRDQEDDPRPRPQGRHRADLPGAARRRRTRRSTGRTSTGRSRSSASAPTPSASSEPEISRIGSDSDPVGLPDVSNATTRASRSARPPSSTSTTGSRTSSPTRRRRTCRAASPRSAALYDAVKLASQQPPNCFENKCTTRPAVLPLQRADPRAGSPGRPTRGRTSSRPARPEAAAQHRDHRGPAGHARGREGGR